MSRAVRNASEREAMMRYNRQERAYYGRCSDGKHVRVEKETYDRIQRGTPELTPNQWADHFEREQGVDLEFSHSTGRTPSISW